MNRTGERIVVIGGTSGIGFAVARLLDSQGATVTVGSRTPLSAEALAQLGPLARSASVDVTSEHSIIDFLRFAGTIDHLVYTAGAALQLMAVADLDLASATDYFDVRCFGILRVVKHAAPSLRPGGSIILTSGIASARPTPGWVVAAGTSGTVEAFGRALAVELAPVRVNVVSPGTIRTPLWSAMPSDDRDAFYAATAAANLTATVSGPDDLARAYAFLMDEPYSTGSVIVVDGGNLLV